MRHLLPGKKLREGTHGWANCLIRAGLLPDDRVANLLYDGSSTRGFLDSSLASALRLWMPKLGHYGHSRPQS